MPDEPKSLQEMLDRIEDAARERDTVSVDDVVQHMGAQSFGPLLVFAGVICVSPLSGIPGLPTTLAAFVLLIAAQMLLGRRCVWLPAWIKRRSLAHGKVTKGLSWVRTPARWIDRALRPRATKLIQKGGATALALLCGVVAIAVPILELVPFVSTLAGLIFTLCGLAIVARDGAVALGAFAVAASLLVFAVMKLVQ